MRARGAQHISERSRATPRLRAVPRAPRSSSTFRRSAHGRGCARTFQLPSFPLGHRRPPTSPPTRRHSSVQSMVHVHPRPRAKAARTDTRSPELGHVGGEHGRTGHRRRARRQRHAVPRAPSCQHKKWRFTVVMHQIYTYMAVYIACTARARRLRTSFRRACTSLFSSPRRLLSLAWAGRLTKPGDQHRTRTALAHAALCRPSISVPAVRTCHGVEPLAAAPHARLPLHGRR